MFTQLVVGGLPTGQYYVRLTSGGNSNISTYEITLDYATDADFLEDPPTIDALFPEPDTRIRTIVFNSLRSAVLDWTKYDSGTVAVLFGGRDFDGMPTRIDALAVRNGPDNMLVWEFQDGAPCALLFGDGAYIRWTSDGTALTFEFGDDIGTAGFIAVALSELEALYAKDEDTSKRQEFSQGSYQPGGNVLWNPFWHLSQLNYALADTLRTNLISRIAVNEVLPIVVTLGQSAPYQGERAVGRFLFDTFANRNFMQEWTLKHFISYSYSHDFPGAFNPFSLADVLAWNFQAVGKIYEIAARAAQPTVDWAAEGIQSVFAESAEPQNFLFPDWEPANPLFPDWAAEHAEWERSLNALDDAVEDETILWPITNAEDWEEVRTEYYGLPPADNVMPPDEPPPAQNSCDSLYDEYRQAYDQYWDDEWYRVWDERDECSAGCIELSPPFCNHDECMKPVWACLDGCNAGLDEATASAEQQIDEARQAYDDCVAAQGQ